MRETVLHRLLAFARGIGSYAVLMGGFGCLAWLAQRLEAVPVLNWGPWEGSSGLVAPLVVVDAGHGGHDGGAVANEMIEKAVALKLAQRVRFHLESQGVRVKMTRDSDVFIPLEKRSETANEANAAAFVSLHLNTSVTAPEVSGIETYFSSRKAAFQPVALGGGASTAPAQRRNGLGEKLARSVQQHACLTSRAENRGIKEQNYAVVLHTLCPAVLVECGFLTHAHESANLQRAPYQDRLAEGIARGIAEFLKSAPSRPTQSHETLPHEPPATADPAAVPEP
jgi:N-acetylmuramoyl-L-alanine amidase